MSMPTDMKVGVPQGSVLSPTLCSLYINDTPQTPGVCLVLLADDTCIYATDLKGNYVRRKLQRGLSAVETECERWNIKINEDKNQEIYFSHRLRSPEAHLKLNGQNIPLCNHVNHLGVIFYKRITWRLHIEMIEAKAVTTFIRIYSLSKSDHLRATIKMFIYKALIISIMTYASSVWELAADTYLLKL
jgi:hypothetical protein